MPDILDELINYLINYLLNEMPEYRESLESCESVSDRKILLRGLMNVRLPKPLDEKFLELQDEYLQSEILAKGIVDVNQIPEIAPKISLWQGDITRLNADAIVNAANSKLLGCFVPGHNCIDNAIHSAAGLQLRDECNRLMLEQAYPEPVGRAKITKAYNLPSKFVLHTVGPTVRGNLTRKNCDDLESCYESCLELAEKNNLHSIAFCCISTGVFGFPNREAAEIAVKTVRNFLYNSVNINRVIFNVFKDFDREIYENILRRTFEV